jgi:hypothetical protein
MSGHIDRVRPWLAVAILVAVAAPCAAVDVVKDGKPVATVVAAGAPAARGGPEAAPAAKGAGGRKRGAEPEGQGETLAVRILVDWVKKITDADLPVAAEPPAGGPAIYVGRAAVQAGLKLDDIQSLSHEGVRIVVDEKRILIAGQSEAATVKAVCRFLETLGCRYFMDGPLGEVYPRTATLAVSPMTVTEQPGLLGRHPKGPSWGGGYWKAWNGAGGEEIQHQHAWGQYVPASLFGEHPEFFAMGKDGSRKAGGWLCTSNPDLRKYFAQRVIDAIAAGRTNPSLSPTDGTGYCQCPACKAQDDPKVIEPSTGLVSVSKRYADFFDAVGRQVAAKYPQSILSFYCYADYTQPPSLGRRLSPNLCAFIAPIRYCRLHAIGDPGCPSRSQEVQMIEGWAKIADKVGYYNYMYNLADATLPFFKFTPCKKDFPYLKDRGLTAMTLEVLSNWYIYGPHIYLGLRMAYDPKADADALMDDYWTKFYGPRAGPHMKAYWMGIDEAVSHLACHSGGFYGLAQVYTPPFLARCEAALAKAADAARDDRTYAERVALAADGLRNAADYRLINEAMARGDFTKAKGICDAMMARIQALVAKGAANREYGTAYLERFLYKILTAGAAATAPPNQVVQVLPDRWRLAYDPDDAGVAKRYPEADFDDSRWPLASTYEKTLDAQGLDRTTILWYRTPLKVPARHGKLSLFFAEVDGWSEVYVNGTKIAVAPPVVVPKAGAKAGPEKSPPKGGGKAKSRGPAGEAGPAGRPPEGAGPRPDGTPTVDGPGPAATEVARPAREGQARPRAPFQVDITEAVRPGDNVLAVRVDHSRITELFLGGILRPVLLVEKAE